MLWGEFKGLVSDDLYRYEGRFGFRPFIKACFLGFGEKYSIWMRFHQYISTKGPIYFPLRVLSYFLLRRAMLRFGFEIYGQNIQPGLYLGHFGGVTVSASALIGRNCNISQGVTIGVTRGGRHPGAPIIGDNVYIAPGAKILGAIKIGNNVVIGANAVVIRDIPDNSVVVGVPARII